MTTVARHVGCGLILLVVGLTLSIGWYLSHLTVTQKFTTAQLRDALVVTSNKSTGYYDWAEGNAINNPNYYIYYLWNITNPEDVLNGAVPIYDKVGPYQYRYIWYNRNATFLNDGDIIQYNLVQDYIFLPNMSERDPTRDMITTLNAAYVTILSTAGGDSNLYFGATLPFISSFVDFLCGEFLDIISSQYTPNVLNTTTQDVISFLSFVFSSDTPTAEQTFYSIWGNGTQLIEVSNWIELFPTVDNTSVIPASTVARLFSNETYSLLDSSPDAIMYWLRANNNESGPEANTLRTTFMLSTAQLHAVLVWRNTSFTPTYVRPALISEAQPFYPSSAWVDVGWVQFTTAAFTAPNSFTDVYGQWYPQFPAQIEIGSSQNEQGVFTVGQVKTLLTGPYGVLNLENFGLFNDAFDAKGDMSPWGVDYNQAFAFDAYMSNLVPPYAKPVVDNFVNSGQTGLILTRSADYWLWRCMDPLVAFLIGPAGAYCGLQVNNSVQLPSQIYSGKNDLAQLGMYVSWRNQTTVQYWNKPVSVYGWTDSGQFSPFINSTQPLYIWDDSFVKTIKFNNMGKTQVQGIDVYKYVLDESAFAASELYTNTIEGFANETSTNQGAPIFLSNFDFYGVTDANYTNFPGLNATINDLTTIYIEPTTGIPVLGAEKAQVNVYYPPGAKGWNTEFKQFAKVRDDIIYPLLKAYQNSTISDSQAEKLRSQLEYFKPAFNEGLLWGFVVFGIVLALIGCILLVRGYKLRQRGDYVSINQI